MIEIITVRGLARPIEFEWQNPDGTPADASGITWRLACKPLADARDETSDMLFDPIIGMGTEEGIVTFEPTEADMLKMAANTAYLFEVEGKDATGTPVCKEQFAWRVTPRLMTD